MDRAAQIKALFGLCLDDTKTGRDVFLECRDVIEWIADEPEQGKTLIHQYLDTTNMSRADAVKVFNKLDESRMVARAYAQAACDNKD